MVAYRRDDGGRVATVEGVMNGLPGPARGEDSTGMNRNVRPDSRTSVNQWIQAVPQLRAQLPNMAGTRQFLSGRRRVHNPRSVHAVVSAGGC